MENKIYLQFAGTAPKVSVEKYEKTDTEEIIWDKTETPQEEIELDDILIEADEVFEPDNTHVVETSAVASGIIPGIIGGIVDIFDGKTKDGQITETQQHSTGDCWLLSGINALSYTEEGRQLIKDALEYENGYTIVHLQGFGDVIVEDSELREVKSQIIGPHQYSTGDDDMVIFELAIEKALDSIANGEVALDPNAPWWMESADELTATTVGNSSTKGGWGAELMYLVTGKVGKRYADEESMKNELKNFEKNNGKDKAMTATCHDEQVIQDINGKDIQLYAPHSYAVKEVNGNVVTVINPHDSSIEIKIDIDTFTQAFSGIEVTDLSNNNPQQDLISETWKTDEDGNKIFIFYDGQKGDYSNRREVIFADNGKPAQITTVKDGYLTAKDTYNPETGEMTQTMAYGKALNNATIVDIDPETGEKTYSFVEVDKNGNTKGNKIKLDYNQFYRLQDNNILDYPQFLTAEIKEMLRYSNNDWNLAMEYLKNNPNASFVEIDKYVYDKKRQEQPSTPNVISLPPFEKPSKTPQPSENPVPSFTPTPSYYQTPTIEPTPSDIILPSKTPISILPMPSFEPTPSFSKIFLDEPQISINITTPNIKHYFV